MFGASSRCSRTFCVRPAVYVRMAYVIRDILSGVIDIESDTLCVHHADIACERFRAQGDVHVLGVWLAVDEDGRAINSDEIDVLNRIGQVQFSDLSAYCYLMSA